MFALFLARGLGQGAGAADFYFLVDFRLRNTLPVALAASSVVTSGLWCEGQRGTTPGNKAATLIHEAPPPTGGLHIQYLIKY